MFYTTLFGLSPNYFSRQQNHHLLHAVLSVPQLWPPRITITEKYEDGEVSKLF